jgi:AbrB family looped-hinge helix DNA binding protein
MSDTKIMRLTSKGQVTVPKELRDAAGIPPGSAVEFGRDGEIIAMRRAAHKRSGRVKSRGEKVVEALRGTRTRNLDLSTDEIMALLRGE